MKHVYTVAIVLVVVVVLSTAYQMGMHDRKTVQQRIEEACAQNYPPVGSIEYDQCRADMSLRFLEEHAKEKRDETYRMVR